MAVEKKEYTPEQHVAFISKSLKFEVEKTLKEILLELQKLNASMSSTRDLSVF